MKKTKFKTRIEFSGEWTGKELYDLIPFDKEPKDGDEEGIHNDYSRYFLEIHGWINHDVCKTIDCHTCRARGIQYDKFNLLKKDNEEVLLLCSEYKDFHEYEILGRYYADRICDKDKSTVVLLSAVDDEFETVAKLFRKLIKKIKFWEKKRVYYVK